ncbi:uncharacterized protein [Littorina saxatilis]|uniref:uncharacterized protein n=1 Tax=Littorina saxatilis TaxID=31220 RepID=UPI0038B50EE8
MSDMAVVEKVKRRIEDLEQAIQRLDYVKRHLNQNSSQIKSQIHTSISRQLETLRQREVWLLEQVDTVVGGKEEVLHGQQARLNKALGILHSSLTHAAHSDDEAATRHLVLALEQLSNTELKAEETPYIAFRAEQAALRESILSYGRVDSNGLPFLSAFNEEDEPSASLPRHLEEYEDSEHHVFYKTLQDGMPGGSSIRVTMPKLSTRVEDWLLRPVLQLSTSNPEVQSPTSERAGTPASQTSCSIQHWLSQIKHNPDGEEDEDFEIVDHSGSSHRASPVEEEYKPLAPVCQEEYVDVFRHIPRDMRLWLLQGGNSGPVEEDLHTFFRHIPTDTSVWLATARRQLETLDELKRGGWFRHIPTEMSTWLRRAHDKRASGAQSAMPDMFAHITRDRNTWLSRPANEEVEMQAQEARSVLKTGAEGKSSYLATPSLFPTPLCSIPDVMKDYLTSAPPAMECWLLQQEAGGAIVSPSDVTLSELPGIQSYLNSNINNNTWLARPQQEEKEEEVQLSTDTGSFFSHISRNKSDWLRNTQGKGSYSSPSRAIDLRNAAKADSNMWLRSGSSRLTEKSTTLPSSPLDSLRQSHSHMTTADWLLGGERRDDDASKSDKSWTVCSSESSLSSVSSLQSVSSGCQAPPPDLAAWIYQKCL